MKLNLLPETYCVCKLSPAARVEEVPLDEAFIAGVRTSDELSIVCRDELAPTNCIARKDGFRCLKVQGPLDFALTGILSSILNPLADAKVSVFTVSTFETDYVLVQQADVNRATDALRRAGHQVID